MTALEALDMLRRQGGLDTGPPLGEPVTVVLYDSEDGSYWRVTYALLGEDRWVVRVDRMEIWS